MLEHMEMGDSSNAIEKQFLYFQSDKLSLEELINKKKEISKKENEIISIGAPKIFVQPGIYTNE